MKKNKSLWATMALAAGLLLSSDAPVLAQGGVAHGQGAAGDTTDGNDSSNANSALVDDDDDDDDDGKGLWGLLGLLGLIGLAGLRRRDRHHDVHVTRTHTTDVPRT